MIFHCFQVTVIIAFINRKLNNQVQITNKYQSNRRLQQRCKKKNKVSVYITLKGNYSATPGNEIVSIKSMT